MIAEEGTALVNIGCSTDAPRRCRGGVELLEGSRSLGSAPFELQRGAYPPPVQVPLSPADWARADSRAGIRATLVVRPAGLEEQRFDLSVRSTSAL